jgi:hypothetical protein
MRLSFFTTALLSATALAAPGAKAEAADLTVRSPNALAEALPIANAAPVAAPAAAPLPAELEPLLHAMLERSLVERQFDIGSFFADIGPLIQAALALLNSNTLVELKTIVDNAAVLLDDQATPAAHNLIIQANRLLTPNNTDILVNLLGAVAPVSLAVPASTALN